MRPQTLSRNIINERFTEVITATSDCVVVYEDILGEGPGGWDSNPRYPQKVVNCLVWLQLVISEIYGKGLADKTAIMDRIRYYGGHVGYSLRKHYLDQWMAFEPEPFVAVDIGSDGATARKTVHLNPQILLADREYPCALYKMNQTVFELTYLTGDGLLQYVKRLPGGYYIMFAVAADKYIERFPGNGPMGLVHSIILHLDSDSGNAQGQASQTAKVYHASIKAGCVLSSELETYVERQKSIYIGYVLYELDPHWDFMKPMPVNDEMRALLNCEAKLSQRRQSWDFKEFTEKKAEGSTQR